MTLFNIGAVAIALCDKFTIVMMLYAIGTVAMTL